MYSEEELERIVQKDFRGEQRIQPRDWLSSKQGVISWYRELRRIESNVSRQVARRRARVKLMCPPSGEQPTKAYLESKQDFDIWHVRVVDLLYLIDERKKHVLNLISEYGLDIDDRTAIEAFEQILEHIDAFENPAIALKHIDGVARNILTKHYERLEKSNSSVAP